MPPEPISTDLDLQIYVHPAAVVSVADALREDEFEEQEFLWITRARFSAAPEIPFAEFRYDYGRYKPPGSPQFVDVDPLDLVGKFVRVVIPATVDGDEERRWYGKFATRSVVFHGTGDNADTPTGTQTFRAFGVLWMLDMEPVLKGHVSIGEAEPLKIDMGIPFNTDKRGSFPARGNRSGGVFDSLAVPGQSHYVFNQQPRGPLPWSAYQAVQYLLERLVPTDAEDVATVQWALAEGTDAGLLSWYDIAVETHGRTVKAILDELIPRHRGVGYRAEFNPETALCEIHVFSFADADITLPSGAVLKANSEQRTLDFDQAYDVEVQVNDVETGRFHRVVVEGEKQTTTLTAPLFYSVGDLFEADWTDDEETAYAAGASGESWYAALDQAQQQAANQMARSSDKLAHVYTRFRLDATSVLRRNRPTIRAWAGQNQSGTVKFYWLAPDIDAETFDPEAAAMLTDAEDYAGVPFWRDGSRFLRQLPLYDRYDYSGTKIDDGENAWKVGAGDLTSGTDQPDFLPPFAFARVTDGASENDKRYALLHRLHETVTDPSSGRQWSVGLQVSTSDPSITLACRPNQLLAQTAWGDLSPAAAETHQDHEPEYNGGLDPEKIFVTVCLELPRHARAEESISAAPPGVPESVLRIEATDCRCDWVCPYTVVAIKSGQMEKTTTGGFVRDDRDRLKDIARAAAEWYGRTRQTLRLNFKTLRNLFEVGWLITDFGSLQKEQVNTVITAIDLEFGEGNQPGRTTIETSYAALDIR